MNQYQIPTAKYFIPESKESLFSYFSTSNSNDNTLNSPCRYVIKQDGLCSGKGVYLPNNLQEIREI